MVLVFWVRQEVHFLHISLGGIKFIKFLNTADLNKEDLMGPRLIAGNSTWDWLRTPEEWSLLEGLGSLRDLGQWNQDVFLVHKQMILGAHPSLLDTPLMLRLDGRPSPYSKWHNRFRRHFLEVITQHACSGWVDVESLVSLGFMLVFVLLGVFLYCHNSPHFLK